MPFLIGQRVCPGAGFSMTEGVLMIAMLVCAFKMEPSGKPLVP
ncbi:MAG: cytochrome P450, partial [Amylibacter sp.]